jgi:hypothetical protein
MSIPMVRIAPASALLCALLGACATSEPYAYLNGARFSRVDFHTSDTIISAIDGGSPVRNRDVMVSPGMHRIELEAAPAGGFNYHALRTLELDVVPCTRYWFDARKENRLLAEFTPEVNYSEPIGGCHAPPSAAAAR